MSSKNNSKAELDTKMIILGPGSGVSSSEVVQKIHMLKLPLTIKSTCYGAMVHGEPEFVKKAVEEVRNLDEFNIFIKDRGFPPGDPRRCRGHRSAPREGFHQLEREFKLLGYVGEALANPQEVSLEEPEKIPVNEFYEIAKSMDLNNEKSEE